jgi:hypothetical protein
MNSNDEITNENLDKFGNDIIQAAELLQVATLSLRSLYVVNSSSVDSFVMLRQKITNEAKIYSKEVLPTSNELIRAIRNSFEIYDVFTSEEFSLYFNYIFREVKRGSGMCDLTLKLYSCILAEFKNNEDEIIKVLNQLKLKTKEYEQKKKELMKSVDVKFSWAVGLTLIPVINVIACPILYVNGSKNIANAIAESEEELLTVAAAEAIKGPLIISITNLVSTFNDITKFYKVLIDKLASIEDDDNLKITHYNMMKDKCQVIIKACKYYDLKIPDANANLQAIPDDYDKNYVEKWLSDKL